MFLQPYGRTSSFSVALWVTPLLERPGGTLEVVVQLEASQFINLSKSVSSNTEYHIVWR